jgi:hypothetical protein
MYQSGHIRMEARLREIQRERKGEAEVDAQQKSFTCAHTSEPIPQGARHLPAPGPSEYDFAARRVGVVCSYRSSVHFEPPLITETGGLMLFVQYQGPTTGARPVYDGRFNMTARRSISEENIER